MGFFSRAMPAQRSEPAPRAMGAPIVINGDGVASKLERIALDHHGHYNEKWLQKLIFATPELLPIQQIEPGFGALIPAAMEVNCSHGNIDNFYVTPTGELVLVEAKLWRNPESRRKVVSQAIDYVAALQSMRYVAFEAAIMRAAGAPTASLYDLVADHPDALDEAAFIDAVCRNLERGRMLVLIVGDGIHRETEVLVETLDNNAGSHFTLALIEIGLYHDGEAIVAIPSTLLKTRMIDRGVVTIEDDRVTTRPAPSLVQVRPQSISDDMFNEALASKDTALPEALKAFVAQLESLGVYKVLGKSLALKVDLPDAAKPLSLGYITKTGQLWTDNVVANAPGETGRLYLERIAALIHGTVKNSSPPYVINESGAIAQLSQLLPSQRDGWFQAAAEFIEAARQNGAGD